MLGVTVDTLRRWEAEGRLTVDRTGGGQRLVPVAEVVRLLENRRRTNPDPRAATQSARNRFAGVVTRIEADRIAAVVEVLAGPHRIVSLMTAEAVAEMGLKVGDPATQFRLLYGRFRCRELLLQLRDFARRFGLPHVRRVGLQVVGQADAHDSLR